MNKDWFVLNTLTGQENKVLTSIEARKKLEGMEEYIGQCVIPTEKFTETKNGKKRTIKRKIFPGYVLVELALYDESQGVDKSTGRKHVYDRTWTFLRLTPGLIPSWLTNYPQPLKPAEVEAIFSNKPKGPGSEDKARPKVIFNVDDTVKLNDGAFMGMTGVVTMVDPDRCKLRVEVAVFSRKTPVDVEYWQVEKVSPEELAEEASQS
jgi:transcriptional antiterminator NusG